MIKAPFIRWVLLKALIFSMLGCSSLKKQWIRSSLKVVSDSKSEEVSFKEPPAPYKRQAHKTLDALWLNKASRASISYFSSCSKSPKSLKAFQASSYPAQSSYKVLKSHKKSGRFYSLLELPLDGTYIAIYTLKKKNCYFNLNFIAPSLTIFKQEQAVFQDFAESF